MVPPQLGCCHGLSSYIKNGVITQNVLHCALVYFNTRRMNSIKIFLTEKCPDISISKCLHC